MIARDEDIRIADDADERDMAWVDEHGRDMTPGPWFDDSGRDWL